MKKRFVVMLLTFVLCLGVTPAFAHGDRDDCKKGTDSTYTSKCDKSDSDSKDKCESKGRGRDECKSKDEDRDEGECSRERYRHRARYRTGCCKPCTPSPINPTPDPTPTDPTPYPGDLETS